MPHQPFVAAAALSYTAVEVFTAPGDLAGEGAVPLSTRIFNVEGAPFQESRRNMALSTRHTQSRRWDLRLARLGLV